MYGAQAELKLNISYIQFENDVEMYGAQAAACPDRPCCSFENDVEMYGAQAVLGVRLASRIV